MLNIEFRPETARNFLNTARQVPAKARDFSNHWLQDRRSALVLKVDEIFKNAEQSTSLWLNRRHSLATVQRGVYGPSDEDITYSEQFTGQPLSNHRPLIYAGGFTLVGLATLAACGAPNSAQVQPAERSTAIPQATSEAEPTKAISKDFVKVLDEEITPELKNEFPGEQIKKVTRIATQNPKDPNNSPAYSVIKTDKDTYVKFDGHKAEGYSTEVVTLETGEVNIRWVTKESAGKDSRLFLIVNLGKLPEGTSLTEATITEAFADQGRLKSYLFYDPDTETYVLYNGVPQNLFQRALDNLVATTYAEGLLKPEKTPTTKPTNTPPPPSPTNTKVPPTQIPEATPTPKGPRFVDWGVYKITLYNGGEGVFATLPDKTLAGLLAATSPKCFNALPLYEYWTGTYKNDGFEFEIGPRKRPHNTMVSAKLVEKGSKDPQAQIMGTITKAAYEVQPGLKCNQIKVGFEAIFVGTGLQPFLDTLGQLYVGNNRPKDLRKDFEDQSGIKLPDFIESK